MTEFWFHGTFHEYWAYFQRGKIRENNDVGAEYHQPAEYAPLPLVPCYLTYRVQFNQLYILPELMVVKI